MGIRIGSIEGNEGQTHPGLSGQVHGDRAVNEQKIEDQCFYYEKRSLTFLSMEQEHCSSPGLMNQ